MSQQASSSEDFLQKIESSPVLQRACEYYEESSSREDIENFIKFTKTEEAEYITKISESSRRAIEKLMKAVSLANKSQQL